MSTNEVTAVTAPVSTAPIPANLVAASPKRESIASFIVAPSSLISENAAPASCPNLVMSLATSGIFERPSSAVLTPPKAPPNFWIFPIAVPTPFKSKRFAAIVPSEVPMEFARFGSILPSASAIPLKAASTPSMIGPITEEKPSIKPCSRDPTESLMLDTPSAKPCANPAMNCFPISMISGISSTRNCPRSATICPALSPRSLA